MSPDVAKIGVVALLAVLEAVALLDVALMARAGLNPIAFVLAAAVFAPWLVIEVRGLRAVLRQRRTRAATVVRLPAAPKPRTAAVHTAATNPTGERMAA